MRGFLLACALTVMACAEDDGEPFLRYAALDDDHLSYPGSVDTTLRLIYEANATSAVLVRDAATGKVIETTWVAAAATAALGVVQVDVSLTWTSIEAVPGETKEIEVRIETGERSEALRFSIPCSCDQGFTSCESECILLNTASNCGACGGECTAPAQCMLGDDGAYFCCDEPNIICDGKCLSPMGRRNCGACGVVCASTQECVLTTSGITCQ